MLERPPTVRLSDAVAAELEKRLLEGSLKPGDKLPPERELAVELGVSRPSLREAIQKLVSKGLLRTRHGGGTHVTDRLEAHFTDPWRDMLAGHPPLQGDLLEFRQMLEGEAASLAAERATDADIARLDAAHEAMTSAYDSMVMPDCIRTDLVFHQTVAECAHNVLIGHLSASLMRLLEGHVKRNLEMLVQHPQRWRMLEGQHRRIWQAVRSRRPVQASEAARSHMDFVRESFASGAIEEERRTVALRRLGESAQVQG